MNNLSHALDDFALSCEADGLSAVTIKGYRAIVGLMIRSLGDKPYASIQGRQMREYIASLRQAKERYKDAPQKPSQAGGLSKDPRRKGPGRPRIHTDDNAGNRERVRRFRERQRDALLEPAM